VSALRAPRGRRALAGRPGPRALLGLAVAAALLAGCRRPPPPAAPARPDPTIRDSGGVGARTFERLKELAGNWTASDLPVTFEVVDRGNAIVQRGGIFAVWHPDGNSLAATVFAEEGYHVRMRSTKIADGPGGELVLELETFDSGNVVPDEPIARALEMTVAPAGGPVTQRWSFGKSLDAPPRELVLTRTEAAAPAPPPAAPIAR